MFLTRKKLNFIRLIAGVYYFLAFFCLAAAIVFSCLGVSVKDLIILFAVSLFMALIVPPYGKYAEGKGKLVAKGNKLVYYKLRPAEFAELYERKRNDPDNVISKPDLQVLAALMTAYDSLGEETRCLEVIDEMEALAARDVIKTRIKLFRASVLYSVGRVEEGDSILDALDTEVQDPITKNVMDALVRGDRALAIGDYEVAETYFTEDLNRKDPKATPLSLLIDHFNLAKIYLAKGETEKAKQHLTYCVENGGGTDMRTKAAEMLENI